MNFLLALKSLPLITFENTLTRLFWHLAVKFKIKNSKFKIEFLVGRNVSHLRHCEEGNARRGNLGVYVVELVINS